MTGHITFRSGFLILFLTLLLGQWCPALFADPDPHITLQPVGQTVMAGTNVTFQVTADGSPPLHYIWGHNSQYHLSGNGDSLTLTNVQLSDAGTYSVYVYNSVWYEISDLVTLIVQQSPIISAPPVSQTVIAGTNVTLTVVATGGPQPTYQWQFNSVDIIGATNSSLTLTNVQAANVGNYTVVTSNFLAAVTSDPAYLAVNDIAPLISPDLTDRVVISQTMVTLATPVYGTTPINYQWRLNGSNIPGATNATLVFNSIQPTNSGRYSIFITNALGYTNSRTATLTVKIYPLPSTIVAWGDNSFGQTNPPAGETNVVALAAGRISTIFLRQDGTMGDFGSEVLSRASYSGLRAAAVETSESYGLYLSTTGIPVGFGLTYLTGDTDVPPTVTNAMAIAIGNPRLALLTDGTVIGWNIPPGWVPTDPGGIINLLSTQSNVIDIAMAGSHCLLLKSNATVVGLGINGNGESTVPPGLNNVAAIAAGAYHSLALKRDGTVVAWGDNSKGQINVPAGLSGVMAISAGDFHNLALKSNGTVVAWGDNTYGQCNVPSTLSNVVFIAAGPNNSAVLTKQPGESIAPHGQSILAGANVTFSFLASGYLPMNYQWQCNGTNISGATGSSLTMTNVPLASAGNYQCIASNAFGITTSSPAGLAVLRQTPQFSSATPAIPFTNGSFSLQLNQLSGHGNIIVEASTDLVNWTAIYTNPPVLGSFQFSDLTATNFPARFYRAFEQ